MPEIIFKEYYLFIFFTLNFYTADNLNRTYIIAKKIFFFFFSSKLLKNTNIYGREFQVKDLLRKVSE